MAIDYSKPLLNKGVLYALEAKLQGNVAALNTALASDVNTAFTVSTSTNSVQAGPVLASHVQVGDLTQTWAMQGNGGFRIRICLPMNAPGFSAQRRTQGASQGAGMSTSPSTDIYCYAHGDLWRNQNKDTEARQVCLVMATILDWARATINQDANKQLILTSHEYGNQATIRNPLGGDLLCDSMISTGSDGYYPVLTGEDTYLHALHLTHSGVAAV